jgi:hypothetical protein
MQLSGIGERLTGRKQNPVSYECRAAIINHISRHLSGFTWGNLRTVSVHVCPTATVVLVPGR